MSDFSIRVPASTANLGPGFDSAGIALSRYVTLHAERADAWAFVHQSVHLPEADGHEQHLIYQSAKQTADAYDKELPPCRIVVESEIPLARGLGSSASAVVAGIELANELCGLSLSQKEKLALAVSCEGHPDNVAPALYGGLVISAQLPGGETEYVRWSEKLPELVICIPDFELKTEDARKVLPEQFLRKEATSASAIGNVMIAALLTGDYERAGRMMEADLFHEPYRSRLIPRYDEIREAAKSAGAFGTVISGAGPTMISFVPVGSGKEIAGQLSSAFPSHTVEAIGVDLEGAHRFK